MKTGLIVGKFFVIVEAADKGWYTVVNKSTGEIVAEIQGLADVMRVWQSYEKAGGAGSK